MVADRYAFGGLGRAMCEVICNDIRSAVPYIHATERANQPVTIFILCLNIDAHDAHRRLMCNGVGRGLQVFKREETVGTVKKPVALCCIIPQRTQLVVPAVVAVHHRKWQGRHPSWSDGKQCRRAQKPPCDTEKHGENNAYPSDVIVPWACFLIQMNLLSPLGMHPIDNACENKKNENEGYEVYKKHTEDAKQFATMQ